MAVGGEFWGGDQWVQVQLKGKGLSQEGWVGCGKADIGIREEEEKVYIRESLFMGCLLIGAQLIPT